MMHLATAASQVQHYAAIRARFFPAVTRKVAAPKPEWSTPLIIQIVETDEQRIATILVELATGRVTAERVISVTASAFGIPVGAIRGRGRTARIAKTRMIAMAISSRFLSGLPRGSLSQIGRAFRRDHTTVLHGVRTYERLVSDICRMVHQ